MIPRIIHQTWKTDRLPHDVAGLAPSWNRHNPSWKRIVWTDRMLVDFVAANYPELYEVFCTYPNPVCRADAARYMLLHKFGGLYADIDVECLAPLTPIESESRLVLCHEPPEHWHYHAPYRGHPFVLFNGVMASPAGHPFWRHLLDRLPETRYALDVLDISGPCLLTGVYLGFDAKESIVIHDCQLFTPTDDKQQESPPYGDVVPPSLTRHLWQASWWRDERPQKGLIAGLVKAYHRARYALTRGPVLQPEEARRRVDPKILDRSPPVGDRVAILVPVRDAHAEIDPFVEAISVLDLPKEKTKIVFCEGDSVDGTREKLEAIAPILRQSYRDVVLLKKDVGTLFSRDRRWGRRLQRTRRGGLAVVRNFLIDRGLDETDDWALWIDVDVWRLPSDLFQRLRSANARIVAPNCVTYPGGPTYDLNSFITVWDFPSRIYYRHIYGGVFQPPAGTRGRLHLDSVRHSERVELDGVGGTTLLVDASLHRGGLRFPEIPYRDLIETEGFGLLARDLGVRAVGLPRVEVLHVPY